MTTDIAVLGDLCLDTLADDRLPFALDDGRPADEKVAWLPLRDRPGGSAFHFATWARRHGLDATVIGCVGRDPAGDALLRSLADEGIATEVWRSDDVPTARVILAHDAKGIRLLLASATSANDELRAEHVQDAWRRIERCRLLWVSGLCLRRGGERVAAAAAASRLARSTGARVVLDLVPHDFTRYYPSLDAVEAVIGPVQGVSSELGTLRRLLAGDGGVGAAEGVGGAAPAELDIEAAVDRMLERTELAIVRTQEGQLYRQVTRAYDGFDDVCTRAAPDDRAVVGFGDSLTCEALSRLLAQPAFGAAR